jgi:hypothetical protein
VGIAAVLALRTETRRAAFAADVTRTGAPTDARTALSPPSG